MSYYGNLATLEGKLAKILNDEGMVYTFKTSEYPITLTVSRNASPSAQMAFFSMNDGASSADAKLQFIFKLDALEIRTDNRLVIPDTLMTKIKGQAKKIHHAFLEGFFAEHITDGQCSTPSTAAPTYTAPPADAVDEFADFFDDDTDNDDNCSDNTESDE